MDRWPVAPRLLEDVYSVADAVVVGGLLISLLKHADRVTSASMAQLVNVIAPIMTEPGGPAWRQTIFHPFAATAAAGRGMALSVRVDAPSHATRYGEVPIVDAVATRDENGDIAVFVVNRSPQTAVTLGVDLTALGEYALADALTLHEDDVYLTNTRDQPDRVQLRPNTSATVDDSRLTAELPPVSWTRLRLGQPASSEAGAV